MLRRLKGSSEPSCSPRGSCEREDKRRIESLCSAEGVRVCLVWGEGLPGEKQRVRIPLEGGTRASSQTTKGRPAGRTAGTRKGNEWGYGVRRPTMGPHAVGEPVWIPADNNRDVMVACNAAATRSSTDVFCAELDASWACALASFVNASLSVLW